MSEGIGFAPGLHHFGLSVANLEETVAWYGEKLGFSLAHRYEMPDPRARVAFMTLKGFRVEIFEVEGSATMPGSGRELPGDLRLQGLKHVALAVDDIERAVATLRERDVEFVTPIGEVQNSGGERFGFFRDNNGLLIELYQPWGAVDDSA